MRLLPRSCLGTIMKRKLFPTGLCAKERNLKSPCMMVSGRSYLRMKPTQREAKSEDGDKSLTRSTQLLDPAAPEAMPILKVSGIWSESLLSLSQFESEILSLAIKIVLPENENPPISLASFTSFQKPHLSTYPALLTNIVANRAWDCPTREAPRSLRELLNNDFQKVKAPQGERETGGLCVVCTGLRYDFNRPSALLPAWVSSSSKKLKIKFKTALV